MNTLVRPAAAADESAVTALWQALHAEHERLDRRYRLADDALDRWRTDFRDALREDLMVVFVAQAPEQIAGFASALIQHEAPVYRAEVYVHVSDLYVHPGHRGRGIGQRLLQSAADWGTARGAGSLRAGVLMANEEALAFWQRAGAVPSSCTVIKPLHGSG